MRSLFLLVKFVEEGKPNKEDIKDLLDILEFYSNNNILGYSTYTYMKNRYTKILEEIPKQVNGG